MTLFSKTKIALAALTLSTVSMGAHAQMQRAPDIYVVMFKADWCAPCKVVEPNLAKALNQLRDPGIEYLEIDISNPGLSEIGAHKAFDRNIVPQYNSWLGVTGFAAIIDGDTKQTLGCVNMLYDANSAATHIRNLKTFAVANQPSFDLTCPEPNQAL
ncbi:thioredoxin family protein [Fretibacter rubidus]|uniref:thioredoxin family protein n=1 Tax=Fretibacter rubidus TaxID=570162 RepID=UPI00352BA31C